MTKKSILEEIKKYPQEVNSFGFIESASLTQLKRLGLAIMFIISPRITKAPNFLREYSMAFNVDSELKSKDKIMGNFLYNSLHSNPELTCTEFFDKYNNRINEIEKVNF